MSLQPITEEKYRYIPSAKRTYNIVSQVAYLIGVKRELFGSDKLRIAVYNRLDQQVSARRIRCLCRLRSALMRSFREVEKGMSVYMKNLDAFPEHFDPEDIQFLQENGVPILKPNAKAIACLAAINQHIAKHIHECGEFFPLWLEWDFLRDMFIMKDAAKESAIRKAVSAFCYNICWFPFQCYINWQFGEEDGNILHHDAKFISLLYGIHGKVFNDFHMVVDAGHDTQSHFHRFVMENEKVAFFVDCENSDPYKLCATFRNIAAHNPDYAAHISKIVLYDDIHSATTWRIFDKYIDGIPVERKVVRRLQNNKSLVDVSMTAGACEAFYANGAQAFVIVSSDSDFWALISALPNAKFLVMLEHGKQSQQFLDALAESGIFYCFIDNFSQGSINDIKTDALREQIAEYIRDAVSLNINTMMETACKKSRIRLTPTEESAFIEKYIKKMRLIIDSDGDVSLALPQ